ncbi:Swt1 family HEPN domain-containing protein [soil metagenome]
MAITNRDRVNSTLELLYQGLLPYVVREMKAEYKGNWISASESALKSTLDINPDGEPHIDTSNLLRLMFSDWNQVFGKKLGHTERSIVSELREARNRAFHQETFSGDDTERTLDNVFRLLSAISAPQAQEVRKQYDELRRLRFDEQSRTQRRRQPALATEGQPSGNLKPWRDIITPHPDVAGGRYQQAEFAADLGQVHRGEGVAEYSNPREFFQRTYLTEGLKRVLVDAVRRLDDSGGGNPVVKLQTNFGGGKTHTMLALYHLFSETDPADLPGVDEVLAEAGVDAPAQANRAVLVGTARGPAQPETKPDGTIVNTLWGDMAWQLLGKDGYDLVAESDRAGSSPGSDILRELFILAEPSLILIDEWVAYVRQLYGINGLPGGSFDANLSFAQALTEAAKAVPGTLVIASLPQSDIETGGEAGQEARASLENTFARIEAVWRPATADESFEIVRRRLFENIASPSLFTDRDVTIRAFIDHYRANPQDFPAGCREGDYERRMQAAYPIHPELFDRLYNDWSTLERFQRTRGVLRLMASVIHTLWERDDHSLLIMPSTIPIDDASVQYELTRYLEDSWQPIIERDVDGPNSLPLQLDRGNPNLGRYSASRRVARSIYMGSAPVAQAANRGLIDQSINLACVQPGESVATFGDALRRLADGATFLYVDGRRYWYSTQPSVNRMAHDRATLEDADKVEQEIIRRLRDAAKVRGEFARVHVAPESPGDVPEDRDARLVILGPDKPHAARNEHQAQEYAAQILTSRGTSPRQFQNTLVFLAADRTRLSELDTAVRQYLAWKSIDEEREALNLDAFQSGQARTKRQEADRTVDQRIPQTFCWLLYPDQPEAGDDIGWTATRLQGDDPLAERASRKLINDGQLASTLGPAILQMRLERIPLWRGNHVLVSELRDFYATYLYLERLKSPDVLLASIQEGVNSAPEYFAYADSFDADTDRYQRIAVNQGVGIVADGQSVVVKSDVARAQIELEKEQEAARTGTGKLRGVRNGTTGTYDPTSMDIEDEDDVVVAPVYRRFFGSVEITDLVRFGREAGKINEEILTHLTNVPGAKVKVTIEIEADFPEGVEDRPRGIVQENASALNFDEAEFERE